MEGTPVTPAANTSGFVVIGREIICNSVFRMIPLNFFPLTIAYFDSLSFLKLAKPWNEKTLQAQRWFARFSERL